MTTGVYPYTPKYEFLRYLAALVAATEGILISTIQGSLLVSDIANGNQAFGGDEFSTLDTIGKIDKSLYLQLAAACTQAGVLARYGPDGVVGYLYILLTIIETLESMNGYGLPDTGNDFRRSAIQLSTNVASALKSASPTTECWSGAGATSYLCLHADYQTCVEKIKETDLLIAGIVANQAGQVEQLREGLAGLRLALFPGIAFASHLHAEWLYFVLSGATGLAAEAAEELDEFGNWLATAMSITALGLISNLISQGNHNHKVIRSVRRTYVSVINDAPSASASSE